VALHDGASADERVGVHFLLEVQEGPRLPRPLLVVFFLTPHSSSFIRYARTLSINEKLRTEASDSRRNVRCIKVMPAFQNSPYLVECLSRGNVECLYLGLVAGPVLRHDFESNLLENSIVRNTAPHHRG
jgi:hypothetical protein